MSFVGVRVSIEWYCAKTGPGWSSRKPKISPIPPFALSNEAPVDARLGGSLALALKGAEAGVQLIRVHDVAETVQALHVWRGLRDRALLG